MSQRTVPLLLKFFGCAVLMAACGCDRAPENAGQGATGAPSDRAVVDLEAKLRLHGFREPAEVKRLLLALRDAATKGDRTALVNAIHYPFTTYDRGSPVRKYPSPAEVLADYGPIFSTIVLDALRDARYESLFVRREGIAVGNGTVWLRRYQEGIRIEAINAGAPQ